jgi:hypothetical protein
LQEVFISENEEKECYWCGAIATSKEHIPPKCLFPEGKDIRKIRDVDFRKDLITVPACDEHNNHKSGDDEILLACLSSVFGANDIAYIHMCTKLNRAYSRNQKLVESSFKILKEDFVEIEGHKFPIVIANVDNKRMLKALEGIARGLYLHEFKERFVGKCTVIPTFVQYEDQDDRYRFFGQLAKVMIQQEQINWKIRGANPQIFTYQFGPIDEYGLRPMLMTFYTTLEVLVAYAPDGHKFPLSMG